MERYRRAGLILLITLAFASGLVACSGFSLIGGVAGGVLTVLAVVFWFATATTQTGCTTQACLSLVFDGGEGEDLGPCLSQIFDGGGDAGVEVGPCLGAPLPDAEVEDVGEDAGPIGPCLSIAPPDAAVDEDAGGPDASPDVASLRQSQDPQPAKSEAIARLAKRGVLPPDVAARLRGPTDEEPS